MKRNKRFKERNYLQKNKKIIIFVLISGVLILIWHYISYSMDIKQESQSSVISNKENKPAKLTIQNYVFSGLKVVHLDLKGAPPKINYYNQLFPLLSDLGATGLLIEYEDMFPYKGTLKNSSALNSYSLEDIRTLNRLAQSSNLTVIPLIQTIGHLEFILKLEEFKWLRAVPEYPFVICPFDERSFAVIFDIIDQIIAAHPHLQIIHIGAGEINYIARCSSENEDVEQNWSKNQLFLAHTEKVVNYIHKRHPHLRILMWDDELRNMSPLELKKSTISSLVEPVVWKYSTDVYTDLGPSLWHLYLEIFHKIWIASAFKGATGSNNYLTEVTHHLENHRSWLSIVLEFGEKIDFQGILITGRQRYDHFSVLCELLPVSLSSLALSLRLLMGYEDSSLSAPSEIARKLQCSHPYGLLGPAFGSPKCSYPGASVLEHVLHFHQAKQEYENIIEDDRFKGWINNYNIKYSFSNPRVVETITSHLQRLSFEMAEIDKDISLALGEVYDDFTVTEWRETYILPLIDKIESILNHKDNLSRTHWPRRPLENRT